LRDAEPEFREAGAGLAVVGLGDQAKARELRDEMRLPFPILVDESRVAYRAAGLRSGSLLHLLRPANFTARRRAKAAGFEQKFVGKNPFQLGGSFVFGPGDVDVLSRPSETFGDNAPVADLLAAVRQVALWKEPAEGRSAPQ
jgi:hypothetical protein